MKKYLLFFSFISLSLMAQKPGYYQGTEGKSGDALKAALHEIINDHVDFSYSDAKYILEYAQEDPDNSSNLITFYTGVSVAKGSSSWGTGDDYLNREHIWAQSHGGLSDNRPMDGDAFNLHAADASVNVTRSNYDFDELSEGTYIEEADAYYNSTLQAFEPGDEFKGEVARTLMYMAVRYEGDNGEMDLELVDELGTSPNATHGKLSTLLEWNRLYPPTDFERRRVDRVYQSQGNRNPFVDHPEWADMIWADSAAASSYVYDMALSPQDPTVGTEVSISFKMEGYSDVQFFWGDSYADIDQEVSLSVSESSGTYAAVFTPSGISAGELVYCQLILEDAAESDTLYRNFYLAPDLSLTAMATIQGSGTSSPLAGQTVNIGGIVTANFDNVFTMQSEGMREAMTVFSNWRGHIGDSVVVTGEVYEYSGLTEISPATMVYSYGYQREILPDTLSIAELSEDYESSVVLLKGVNFQDGGSTFSLDGGTYVISDGVNELNVYVRYNSRLGGQEIPNGTVNVKGIYTEYSGAYQLLINDTSWISTATDNTPPEITSVSLEDRDDNYVWLYVNFNEIVDEADVEEETNFSISDGVVIKRNYYDSNQPNQAKMIIENIGVGDYTLTVTNIKDAFGNVMEETSINFTSTIDKTTALSSLVVDPELSVYPLPVSEGRLHVKAAEPLVSLAIYALDGRMLLREDALNSTEKEVDLSTFDAGHYILHVEFEDQSINQHITIQ